MSSLTLAWQAISPTPVERGALVEPEATDRVFSERPWLHFPPGAALLIIACTTLLLMAAFQSGVNVVRRDGLRDGIREELADTIPIQLDMLEQPVSHQPGGLHHRRARTHHAAKLHRLMQQNNATPWSNDQVDSIAAVKPVLAAPIASVATPLASAAEAP